MSRRPAARLPCATLALLLSACAPAATVPSAAPLHAQLGQQVELAGRFAGPAKLGDFVDTGGDRVFLREPSLPAAGIAYGTDVVVGGRLEHDAGSGDECDPSPDCVAAGVPAHFYIERASVRPLQR